MTLRDIMVESEKLTTDEKLRLASYLIEQARSSPVEDILELKWSDMVGAMRYPMVGKDAQEWVSEQRGEWQ